MSAILRGAICRTAPIVRSNITQKATIVSGPPRVRIPFWEKMTIGTLMGIGIAGPSFYFLANITNYRSRPGVEE